MFIFTSIKSWQLVAQLVKHQDWNLKVFSSKLFINSEADKTSERDIDIGDQID